MTISSSVQHSAARFSPTLRFSILGAVSLLLWWRPLITSFALASHDERYTQLLLIVPLSLTLLCINWKASELPETGSNTGFVLLISALLLTFVTKWQAAKLGLDEQLSLNMLGLVIWWMGAFIVSFGSSAFRRALFPLCFLLWLVPLPEFALNPIVTFLQQGSVRSAQLLFAAFGVPVVRTGMLLDIPKLTIEVAPQCSSIRSSLMLLVTTMVIAQVTLGSLWRKALVVAIAIPLSIAKNGLRIFVLGMLATRVDRSYLTGRLHHQGGVIYFAIALVVVFFLVWLLRRNEERASTELSRLAE